MFYNNENNNNFANACMHVKHLRDDNNDKFKNDFVEIKRL